MFTNQQWRFDTRSRSTLITVMDKRFLNLFFFSSSLPQTPSGIPREKIDPLPSNKMNYHNVAWRSSYGTCTLPLCSFRLLSVRSFLGPTGLHANTGGGGRGRREGVWGRWGSGCGRGNVKQTEILYDDQYGYIHGQVNFYSSAVLDGNRAKSVN